MLQRTISLPLWTVGALLVLQAPILAQAGTRICRCRWSGFAQPLKTRRRSCGSLHGQAKYQLSVSKSGSDFRF